ncbi:molybdenum ABC transporter ATP-binding protein [Hahella sp. CR1]|uniref:molybdenum ABC transporter ATP-binding protein n=1 Tax=Hahella sp. CR1 TaxID=2992807 RepID=UPI00244330A5|nr:molybdenum ABC transporter ATP-binding protein [Hahella sp. CR1]MDG9667277.1 molybdenum ABC transporter ATP-binding protein [Hahella sp. CR1]
MNDDISASFFSHKGDFTLDVAFTTPGQGVTALFGRSGSGKTTLLRFIAGLERAEKGALQIKDEVWQSADLFVPPHRRALGYVFQEPSLFAHLSVMDNLLYGYHRIPQWERRVAPEEVIRWLELEPLIGRNTHSLSGGQRQRVAIGRALLTSPKLLLMDEPLASLDLQSKEEILPYLDELFQQLDIPVFYVSHSPDEVMRLASHLVLLDHGGVRAGGPINDLLTRPDLPLAHLEEASAVVHANIQAHDLEYHQTLLGVPGGVLAVHHKQGPIGQQVRLRIHAKDVSLALKPPELSSISNCIPVKVIDINVDREPSQVVVRLALGEETILARVTRRSIDQLHIERGMQLFAQVKSVALID